MAFFVCVHVLAVIPSCLYTMHKYPAILKSFKHQGVPVWVEKTDQSDSPSFGWSLFILLYYSVLELFSDHTYEWCKPDMFVFSKSFMASSCLFHYQWQLYDSFLSWFFHAINISSVRFPVMIIVWDPGTR